MGSDASRCIRVFFVCLMGKMLSKKIIELTLNSKIGYCQQVQKY